jgi:hypothetical protein
MDFMAGFLKFSMVVWTVDKEGKRYPSAAPIAFKLATPIQDFRRSAPGFEQGLWFDTALSLQQNVADQMVEQATPIGPLAALSEEYAKRKAKQHPGAPILVASGEMFRGFFSGADHVFIEGPQGMQWGNRNPLAGYHFRGHETPTPLPRRPLGMPPADFGKTVLRPKFVRYCNAAYRQEGWRVAASRGETIDRVTATQWGKESFMAAPAMPLTAPAMPI